MDAGKVVTYAVIGVAGYYALAKLGVFGDRTKTAPFAALYWKAAEATAPLYSAVVGHDRYTVVTKPKV